MKILLDEDLPVQLRLVLSQYDVFTIQWMGWKGKENGELLQLMEQEQFDVFLTADKNLHYQQNLSGFRVSVILLHLPRLRMEEIEPLIPEIKQRLDFIKPGHLYHIGKESHK
jgi:predicted nuclease of predicted toxin-antitoxin system